MQIFVNKKYPESLFPLVKERRDNESGRKVRSVQEDRERVSEEGRERERLDHNNKSTWGSAGRHHHTRQHCLRWPTLIEQFQPEWWWW